MSNDRRIAVVTGAGSGVGQAVAVKLANAGWQVVVVGRSQGTLDETVNQCGAGRAVAMVCDVADPAAVEQMGKKVLGEIGPVEVLVNSAGTNVPQRKLDELSVEDYRQIVEVNLNGTYYCVQAFLPQMRQRKSGTIVNVISDAGVMANAMSGIAYVASKFGAVGLTATINAEERKNGIRACGILHGEIDTPLLKKRPSMPSEEHRARMLRPEDVAECVMLAINLPERAVVEQLLVRPR